GEEIPEEEVESAMKSREIDQAVRETDEAAAHEHGAVARAVRLPEREIQPVAGDEEDVGAHPGDAGGCGELQLLDELAGSGQSAVAAPDVLVVEILFTEEVQLGAERRQEARPAGVRGE